MQGHVVQINISNGGVPKYPIPDAMITPLGVEGDKHAHPQIHGGPLQRVLLITMEAIEELRLQGFPVEAGSLGENITTRGIDRRKLRIGQQFRIGQVVIELTKVRAPCNQLDIYGLGIHKAVYDKAATKANDTSSPTWAISGFYASVVSPGAVRVGDPILLLSESA